jgi:hypothetical protein
MTFLEAKTLRVGDFLYHKTATNTIGQVRVRVIGKPKVWKSRPKSIRISCKYGLKSYHQIGQGETDKTLDCSLKEWSLTPKLEIVNH